MASRIMSGAYIILFVLVVNVFAAFLTTGATTTPIVAGCSTTNNNATVCEGSGKSSFFGSVFDTTITGFDGAPLFLNVVWGLIMGFLLTVAVLLIVVGFIPWTNS